MRTIEQLKKDVLNAIDANREKIIAISEEIWRNPEPGYREFKTSALAVKKLKSLGLNVKENLAITGFRADICTGRQGPVLALLGEMDSLILPSHPAADKTTGAVHACGHNTHIAAMLGAAMGFVEADADDDLAGKIAFVGVPAEEAIETDFRISLIKEGRIKYLSGKPELIRCGAFDDVDMAFMNHIGWYYIADFNGYVKKIITFIGKSCHAASPQAGVNALNAANLAMHAIALMRETFANDDRIRVHGIIIKGGDIVNIIPDCVIMDYMVRADTIEKIKSLSERFDNVMRHSALALGAKAKIQTFPGSMPLENDDTICNLFREAVKYIAPGEKPIIKESFNQGCTDMGDLSQIMPAVHGGVPGCSGICHGIDFKISDPESACITSAKIMSLITIDLLYGNAEKGKTIAAKKADKMPIADYLNTLDALTCIDDQDE